MIQVLNQGRWKEVNEHLNRNWLRNFSITMSAIVLNIVLIAVKLHLLQQKLQLLS